MGFNVTRSLVIGFFFLFIFSLYFCNSDSSRNRSYASNSASYTKEGLDKVIEKYRSVDNFTILLYDMNYENSEYKHKYQVITEEVTANDTTVDETVTDWYTVTPGFFKTHQDHMGMELASKDDGKLSKTVAPAGYSQYVGNEKYGQWEQRNGTSFWAFYGQYAFMRSLFGLDYYPARYGYWDTYYNDYRGRRNYTGPSGYYGTSRYVSGSKGKSTTWGSKPSSFKQDVRSRVQRSTSTTNRTSRSSGRYSSSSRTRSRSGGFGK